MREDTAEVVICGAGIAGISSAYHLAIQRGVRQVVIVDERSPLSLTSDKSSECYRNWWPGPGNAMVALMNRSIDLMEELALQTGNIFHLNRRGYLYVSGDPEKVEGMRRAAEETARLGAGPLRLHAGQVGDPVYLPASEQGFANQPDGADLFLDPGLIRGHFPYLAEGVAAALHVRRAGWFSAQQLGAFLLEQARACGVRLLEGRVEAVETQGGRVQVVRLQGGRRLFTPCFVNAAGPYLGEVARLVGVSLPVYSELHLKAAFNDPLGVVPRSAPLLIWNDPQILPWTAEEREFLAEDEEYSWLLGELPAGAHTRPEGGTGSPVILVLWEYRTPEVEPVWPPELDPQYPEIALRGVARMLPGLQAYLGKASRPVLDGGYYTRTRENRPLIGRLPPEGAFLIGALSGFGLMAACAAGELLAALVTGADLPGYAPAFAPERYEDPHYQSLLENWGDSGQL